MMLSWKFPSPIWPRMLANKPRSSISFLLTSIMSASLLKGTATSVLPKVHVSVDVTCRGLHSWLTNFLAILAERKHRPERLLASRPQQLLLPSVLGELKVATLVCLGYLLNEADVLLHAGLGARKLE